MLTLFSVSGDESKELLESKMCGPYSLSIAAERIGIKLDPIKIARIAGVGKSGVSMRRLADAAYQMGLEATGRKLSLAELVKLKPPIIILIRRNSSKPNHFLVMDQVIGDSLRLIDPPGIVYLISKEEFAKIWSGYALVLSKQGAFLTFKDEPDIHVLDPHS